MFEKRKLIERLQILASGGGVALSSLALLLGLTHIALTPFLIIGGFGIHKSKFFEQIKQAKVSSDSYLESDKIKDLDFEDYQETFYALSVILKKMDDELNSK